MRYVIASALAITAAVDFFSVRSISKVINRKQNGHVVVHGLYVYKRTSKLPSVGVFVRRAKLSTL